METLNKRLHHLRETLGCGKMQFANLLGIAHQKIAQYEEGTLPRADFFEILKQQIPTLNLNWLMSSEGDMFLNGEVPQLPDVTKRVSTNSKKFSEKEIEEVTPILNDLVEQLKEKDKHLSSALETISVLSKR